ncbi:hypothetical protein [Bacillus sp. AFS015896]|uniref:hypothetical protein n=1 Tax=Bacillus sp. AFS015896 TaxID=2033487 RepID=UPI0015CEF6EE|nr:hypothetical protein [Bacillus sp. AFS015896]
MGKTLFIVEKPKIAVESLKSSSRELLIEEFSQNMSHKHISVLHINGIELVL